MAANFISLHPRCAVISEWNNTDDEEPRNKSAIVLATGSPYQNNEGPLQRDEVKATFNKEENNDNARKSARRFLLLLHRRVPFVIFRTISTLLYTRSLSPSSPLSPHRRSFSLFGAAASKIQCRSRTAFSFHVARFFSPFFSFLLPPFLPFRARRETTRRMHHAMQPLHRDQGERAKEERRNLISQDFLVDFGKRV